MTAYSELVPLVAVDLPECPDLLIEHHIREAVIAFCRASRCYRTTLAPISVTANTSKIALTTPDGTYAHELPRPGKWLPTKTQVFPRTVQQLSGRPDWEHEVGAAPQFMHVTGINEIRIVPMIDADATDALELEVVLLPLRSSTEFDSELNELYQPGLIAGAKLSLQLMPGRDWMNPQAAAENAAIFNEYVSIARTRRFRNGTRGVMQAAPVSFGA